MVDAPKSEEQAVDEAAATSEAKETEGVEAAGEPAAESLATESARGQQYDQALVEDDDEEFVPVAEPTTYRVVTRTEEKVIDGRIESVEFAKSISTEGGQSVLVERTDGRVKMNFRDGSLVDYVIETRKGRTA